MLQVVQNNHFLKQVCLLNFYSNCFQNQQETGCVADLIRHISFAQNKKSGHPLCTHTYIYVKRQNTAAGLIVTILSYNDFVFKVKLLQKNF